MLEVDPGDNGHHLRGAHLGLATAGGGGLGLSQIFKAAALFERMQGDTEVRVGEDAGDRAEGRAGIAQAAGEQLIRGRAGNNGGGGVARESAERVGRRSRHRC